MGKVAISKPAILSQHCLSKSNEHCRGRCVAKLKTAGKNSFPATSLNEHWALQRTLRCQIETSLFPSNVSQRAMSIAEDVALPN